MLFARILWKKGLKWLKLIKSCKKPFKKIIFVFVSKKSADGVNIKFFWKISVIFDQKINCKTKITILVIFFSSAYIWSEDNLAKTFFFDQQMHTGLFTTIFRECRIIIEHNKIDPWGSHVPPYKSQSRFHSILRKASTRRTKIIEK